jgi:hypothetical protein
MTHIAPHGLTTATSCSFYRCYPKILSPSFLAVPGSIFPWSIYYKLNAASSFWKCAHVWHRLGQHSCLRCLAASFGKYKPALKEFYLWHYTELLNASAAEGARDILSAVETFLNSFAGLESLWLNIQERELVDKSCFVRHCATLAALGVNCKDACSMWYSVADLRIILDSCKDLKSLVVSFPMLGEGRRTFFKRSASICPAQASHRFPPSSKHFW